MRTWLLLGALISTLTAGLAISAQTPTGRIEGQLASARGPLSGVEVRVKNTSTGEVSAATTSASGDYSIAVSPGVYDVFASPVGYTAFARRAVSISKGATVRADGTLGDNLNAGTPGEIYFSYAREGAKAQTGPAPKTADGKPDLSGVWLPGYDLEPEVLPYQPWAEALTKERASHVGDDPRAHCLPTGVVRMSNIDLVKFVQTTRLLVILVEGSVPGVRQVFLDGRAHPENLSPTWLGHSIGTWDHDTLVVDTVGFNDKGWLDVGGRPQTEHLHVIERFHRLDLGRLDLEITVDDPGAYTRQWKLHRLLQLAPGEEIQEYICNENNQTEHFVGTDNAVGQPH